MTRQGRSGSLGTNGEQSDTYNGGQEVDANDLPIYRNGSIKRVKLHNFMTYDDCVFEPGPGLNLVLGPNGTGKSSIVSALCVGLAGNPRVLSRASRIKDYIKRGKTSGYIEITLHRDPPKNDVKIRRHFRSSGSDWRINDKVVPVEKVKRLMQKLNIQFDNLTQFLPQDRVSEFAALSPVDLLKQTEKVVLHPNTIANHEKLIEMQKNNKDKVTSVEELRKNVEILKKKKESLERDVQRIREREELLEKVEQLKLKLSILEFNKKQGEGKVIRDELKAKEEELKELEKAESPLDIEFKKLKAIRDRSKQEENELRNRYSKLERECEESWKKLNDLDIQVDNYKKHLVDLKSKKKKAGQRLQECQTNLERARQEIAEMEAPESIDPQIEELGSQREKITSSLNNIGNDKTELNDKIDKLERNIDRIKRRLAEFDSIRERRLTALRRMNVNHEIIAYKWIEQNKQRFQGNVYFIPLEISVRENLHAQYLENHCPRWLLQSFVCDNVNDREFIVQELIDLQKLNITVTYADYSPGLPDRICDINNLRQYGVTHFLDEVFDAPAIVKQVMNDNAQLFKVACGTNKTADTWDEMFRNTPVKSAFSPSSRYLAKFSRYGNKEMSTSIFTLKDLKIFQGIDMSVKRGLEEEKKELNDQIRKLMLDMKDIQESERTAGIEQEIIQAKINTLQEKRRNYMRKKNAISSLEKECQRLNRGEDTASEELRIKGKIAEINKKRVFYAIELSNMVEKSTDLSLKFNKYKLEENIFKQAEDKYTMERQVEEQKKRELMRQINEVKEQFKYIKNELKRMKNEVEKSEEGYLRKHSDITKEDLNQRYAALPDSIEQVKDRISIEKAKADDIQENPKVIQEYEKRKKELQEETQTLEKLEQELANYNNIMEELKMKWLAELEPSIKRINDTFATYCKNIGISGEVSLGREKEFDKWSVQIRVKFRDNESLTILNANRQSGGERSVTTMLYLLSLQQLNKCPFRVVDEINQGMDPQNERKIFYLMLDSSRGRDAPQSFLITPKLLLDLVPSHANNITILFIYNGPLNSLSNEEWHKYEQAIIEANGNAVNGIHSSDEESEDIDK